MNLHLSKKTWLAISITAACLVIGGLIYSLTQRTEINQFGHGGPFESSNYATAIGSAASPATLTSSYNGASSSILLARGIPNISIGGTYTPKSYGSSLFLLVERSIDMGETFLPYTVLAPSVSSTPVYVQGASSTTGIPFVIPGSGTAASGTAITFSFDLTMTADYIRIKAKESTTSTAGTLNAQVLLTSN